MSDIRCACGKSIEHTHACNSVDITAHQLEVANTNMRLAAVELVGKYKAALEDNAILQEALAEAREDAERDSEITSDGLMAQGWNKFSWNNGTIMEYWKPIQCADDQNRCVCVRFGEHPSSPFLVYLRFPQYMYAMRHIDTMNKLNALYRSMVGYEITPDCPITLHRQLTGKEGEG